MPSTLAASTPEGDILPIVVEGQRGFFVPSAVFRDTDAKAQLYEVAEARALVQKELIGTLSALVANKTKTATQADQRIADLEQLLDSTQGRLIASLERERDRWPAWVWFAGGVVVTVASGLAAAFLLRQN